jgi:hypothetical protein
MIKGMQKTRRDSGQMTGMQKKGRCITKRGCRKKGRGCRKKMGLDGYRVRKGQGCLKKGGDTVQKKRRDAERRMRWMDAG